MKTSISIAIAIGATVSGSAAMAQPAACELHIWPAERMSSTTTGLLSGFGVVGAWPTSRPMPAATPATARKWPARSTARASSTRCNRSI